MSQQRLFVLAPEAIALTAVHDGAGGWRLTVSMRRQDELWADAYRASYSFLSTEELGDVVCAEVCRLLDLA